MTYKRIIYPTLTVVFIILLTVFTLGMQKEYTQLEILDEQQRLSRLNALDFDELSEKDQKDVTKRIAETEEALKILPHRTTMYKISMIIIAVFYIALNIYTLYRREYMSPLLSALFMLLAIGTTYHSVFLLDFTYLCFLVVSIIAAIVVYAIWSNFKSHNDILFYVIAGTIVVLLLVNLIFGKTINGARLWIIIGPISFQPGEFVKLLLIALAAISYKNFKRALIYCGLAIISCGLLLVLHDLGNAIAIFVSFIYASYLLYDNIKFSLGTIVASVVAFIIAVFNLDYARERVLAVGKIMTEYGDQQRGIIRATIFGGFSGLGFDFDNISTYVTSIFSADSDLSLAGLLATFGVPMFIIALLCYITLILQPAYNRSIHPSSYIILSQVSVFICVQVLLNFLGAMNIIPFTGIVAPWISNGGSAMVTFTCMLGLCAASLNAKITGREVEAL